MVEGSGRKSVDAVDGDADREAAEVKWSQAKSVCGEGRDHRMINLLHLQQIVKKLYIQA